MGYDVSIHPISPEEMREWYFTPLTWIQQGQEEKVLALAAQHGMEDFYAEKYLNTLRVGAETESNELFDKSHGFYIAVPLLQQPSPAEKRRTVCLPISYLRMCRGLRLPLCFCWNNCGQ